MIVGNRIADVKGNKKVSERYFMPAPPIKIPS
jgi:hypothetical protein